MGSPASGSDKVAAATEAREVFIPCFQKHKLFPPPPPPEEHVMCENIRDIAKWLRDITVEIFHQSINLPSLPSLPTPKR